jgi:hypothetical protein
MLRRNDRGVRTILGVILALGLAGLAFASAGSWSVLLGADDEPADNLAAYYGFGRLELYKLNQRAGNMLAADLNNDGRTDIILIENSNSRLDILQQRAKPEAAGKPEATGKSAGPARVNAIESDKRLEHKKVAVERELASLVVGDFNGDGRKDLAWFGVPDQLTIAYQSATGDWTNRKRVRLPDIAPAI